MKKMRVLFTIALLGFISACATEPGYYDDYDYAYYNGYGVGYDSNIYDDWFYDYYDYDYYDEAFDSYYDYDYDGDVFGWEEDGLFD